jgi:hypothetical protein
VVMLRALVLVAYIAGVAGVLSSRSLRRQAGVRPLLLIGAVYFALLPFLRSPNSHDYLVHMVPLYCALLALWLTSIWDRRTLPRPLVATAAAGLVLLQIGGVAQRAYANTYLRNYQPVVEYLQAHRGPDDLIMGSAELGFSVGFTSHLIDDTRLGYYSGRHAEFIVIDDRYQDWIDGFPVSAPAVGQHVERLLREQYIKVYDQNTYVVYRCREHGHGPLLAGTRALN